MKYPLIISSTSLLLPFLLLACSTHTRYPDEPTPHKQIVSSAPMSYLALAFPAEKTDLLALQLALVKHKNTAADKERWLLLRAIPYQWLTVEWQGEQLLLLAVGPFEVGPKLSAERQRLQSTFGPQLAMPAIAMHSTSKREQTLGQVLK